MSLVPGTSFGNYEILRLLGRGGMGEVYLASDKSLKRHVAIKVLSSELIQSSDQLRRFRKEASYAAVLNHPNICTIYETGEIDGQTYIAMEYLEGVSLRQYISAEPIPLKEVLDIAIQIADALDEARKKNVIHRDIKTSNILLTPRKLVKVLDFGLAKQMPTLTGQDINEATTASSMTHPGESIRGTTAYMSPEAVLGKPVDHRSDIFSFGVVLYEMLTGRVPFAGNSIVEVLDAILNKEATPVTRYNDKVPDALMRVVKKMLEKDVENRYQSVHEVWIDLRRIKEESTTTGMESATQPVQRVRVNRRSQAIVAVVVGVVVLVGVLYLFKQQQRQSPSYQAPASTAENKTLAVLPFQYTGDTEHKYLGSMVTDALIVGLQSEPGLIIAPYATVREVNEKAPIQDIARELGVRWIVRGEVSSRASDLQISPEMVSSDGETLWSEKVRGSADRLVSTLDATKNALLRELKLAGKSTGKPIDQLRTPSMEAYRDYLLARSCHEQWDKEGNLDEAITLYKKALAIDPDFAAAHAGLAMTLVSQYFKIRTPSLLVDASSEAQKAIALDSDLPEALIANGLIHLASGKSVEAGVAFGQALELAPGNDAACRNIAYAYATLNRHDEARQMYSRAIALRPSYWLNHYELGRYMFSILGNLDEARVHLLKANELYPDGPSPLILLGLVDLTRGDLANAETFFRKVLERSSNSYAQNGLGLVYYYRGQYDLALRNWQALLLQEPNQSLYQANVADALRAMGDHAEARNHYILAIQGFRAELAANPQDDPTRAGMAMALSAIGRCEEAREEIRDVLSRQSQSPELATYAAVTASRCGDHKWATQIVLDAIAIKNVMDIRFHPDLESIRQVPEVKRALANPPKT